MVPPEYHPDFAQFREIVRQQFLIVHLDEERAIEALPTLAASARIAAACWRACTASESFGDLSSLTNRSAGFPGCRKLLAPQRTCTARESVAAMK